MPHQFDLPSYRYSTLFACLLFFFVIMPFIDRGDWAQIATEGTLLGFLAFFVYLVSQKRRVFLISLSLAVPASLGTIGDIVFNEPNLQIVGLVFIVLFLTYVLWVFFLSLFQTKTVDTNMIYGAVCIYLLLAIEWGLIYSLLEITLPGSFQMSDQIPAALNQYNDLVRDLIYYSFITLTTTGYGDIVPLTQAARYFSMLESFLGQLYLTILVARLVGMHIAMGRK